MRDYLLGQVLLDYYWRNRGVGHTTLALEGMKHYDSPNILIVAGWHDKFNIKRGENTRAISMDDMNVKLRGVRDPILVDNHAMIYILNQMATRISNLEALLELKQST